MTSTTFFIIFVPILGILLLALNLILAPHNPYQEKDSAFECGFHSFLGQNRTQFSVSFFIFALLFLLFDLEIVLIYPYSVSSYTNDIYGLVVMMVFFVLLTLGFIFELGKNALTIDSRQTSLYDNEDKNEPVAFVIKSRMFTFGVPDLTKKEFTILVISSVLFIIYSLNVSPINCDAPNVWEIKFQDNINNFPTYFALSFWIIFTAIVINYISYIKKLYLTWGKLIGYIILANISLSSIILSLYILYLLYILFYTLENVISNELLITYSTEEYAVAGEIDLDSKSTPLVKGRENIFLSSTGNQGSNQLGQNSNPSPFGQDSNPNPQGQHPNPNQPVFGQHPNQNPQGQLQLPTQNPYPFDPYQNPCGQVYDTNNNPIPNPFRYHPQYNPFGQGPPVFIPEHTPHPENQGLNPLGGQGPRRVIFDRIPSPSELPERTDPYLNKEAVPVHGQGNNPVYYTTAKDGENLNIDNTFNMMEGKLDNCEHTRQSHAWTKKNEWNLYKRCGPCFNCRNEINDSFFSCKSCYRHLCSNCNHFSSTHAFETFVHGPKK